MAMTTTTSAAAEKPSEVMWIGSDGILQRKTLSELGGAKRFLPANNNCNKETDEFTVSNGVGLYHHSLKQQRELSASANSSAYNTLRFASITILPENGVGRFVFNQSLGSPSVLTGKDATDFGAAVSNVALSNQDVINQITEFFNLQYIADLLQNEVQKITIRSDLPVAGEKGPSRSEIDLTAESAGVESLPLIVSSTTNLLIQRENGKIYFRVFNENYHMESRAGKPCTDAEKARNLGSCLYEFEFCTKGQLKLTYAFISNPEIKDILSSDPTKSLTSSEVKVNLLKTNHKTEEKNGKAIALFRNLIDPSKVKETVGRLVSNVSPENKILIEKLIEIGLWDKVKDKVYGIDPLFKQKYFPPFTYGIDNTEKAEHVSSIDHEDFKLALKDVCREGTYDGSECFSFMRVDDDETSFIADLLRTATFNFFVDGKPAICFRNNSTYIRYDDSGQPVVDENISQRTINEQRLILTTGIKHFFKDDNLYSSFSNVWQQNIKSLVRNLVNSLFINLTETNFKAEFDYDFTINLRLEGSKVLVEVTNTFKTLDVKYVGLPADRIGIVTRDSRPLSHRFVTPGSCSYTFELLPKDPNAQESKDQLLLTNTWFSNGSLAAFFDPKKNQRVVDLATKGPNEFQKFWIDNLNSDEKTNYFNKLDSNGVVTRVQGYQETVKAKSTNCSELVDEINKPKETSFFGKISAVLCVIGIGYILLAINSVIEARKSSSARKQLKAKLNQDLAEARVLRDSANKDKADLDNLKGSYEKIIKSPIGADLNEKSDAAALGRRVDAVVAEGAAAVAATGAAITNSKTKFEQFSADLDNVKSQVSSLDEVIKNMENKIDSLNSIQPVLSNAQERPIAVRC